MSRRMLPPGAYQALVSAQVAAGGDGTRVGAAAATRLTFQVAALPASDATDPPTALGRGSGWVIALVVLLGLWPLARLARRYTVSIERRR